jgi:histidyl-tRNA synthetase
MKIQSVKGTRDFYPPQMAVRNFIIDGWKSASLRNGFEEYDGPIFEYLKMFQIKSGDEIAEQLFNFTDRGGRALAIRPEITPTLARMVNQKINSLPRPIKWFSVPRLCRAERPQKGRFREFFQWNIDIIGVDNVLADAEVIFTAVDYLRQVGLTADDIVVKISSRKMLAALLRIIDIAPNQLDDLYTVLDKRTRVPAETFEKMLAERITDSEKRQKVLDLMTVDTIEQIGSVLELDSEAQQAADELTRLFELLSVMGITDFCRFDIGIVRGLAYYTGIVFEIDAKTGDLRAICGGGRFDNLLADFGGPSISATGMGMGDCVLGILLEEKGLLKNKPSTRSLDYFVAYANKALLTEAIEITASLRKAGRATDFSYKAGSLKKQLKEASLANSTRCIIVGQEYENGQLVVKDMATGNQETVSQEKFWDELEGRKG